MTRWARWAILAVGSRWAGWAGRSVGAWLSGLSIAARSSVVAGQTGWSSLAIGTLVTGSVGSALSGSAGVTAFAIWAWWSGRSVRAGWSSRAGLSVVAWLAWWAWWSVVSSWASWAWWAWWARWAWVAWWDLNLLADNWRSAWLSWSARSAGSTGLAVGARVASASRMTRSAASFASASLTLDDGAVRGEASNVDWSASLGAHLLHDVTSGRLAILQIALGLLLHVVNKVVNHRHGDADGEDGD